MQAKSSDDTNVKKKKENDEGESDPMSLGRSLRVDGGNRLKVPKAGRF